MLAPAGWSLPHLSYFYYRKFVSLKHLSDSLQIPLEIESGLACPVQAVFPPVNIKNAVLLKHFRTGFLPALLRDGAGKAIRQ